jgi:hypothetical protein
MEYKLSNLLNTVKELAAINIRSQPWVRASENVQF